MKLSLSIIILILSISGAFSQNTTYRKDFEEATRIFKERNYKEAEVRFKQLLENASELDSVLLVEVKFGLAKAYVHQGQSAKSMPIYYDIRKDVLNMDNDSLLAEVNFSLSSMFEFRSQYDSVEILQHQTLKLPGLSQKTISDVTTLLSRMKTHKLEYDSAEIYLKRAIAIDYQLKDSSSLPYNLLDLGMHYKITNYTDSAIYYGLKGLNYLRKGRDDYKFPSFYERIAAVFLQAGNMLKAEEYANLSIEKAQELNLNVSEERGHILLAELKRIRSDYESALPIYFIADSLNRISNKQERGAIINRGIIECKLATGAEPDPDRIQKLEEFANFTQSELEKTDCELVLLRAQLNSISIPEFYRKLDEIRNSKTINDLFYERKLLKLTYDFEVENKLWQNAVNTNKTLNQTIDSLSQRNTKYVAYDLEAKYQKREQDKQIEFLDNENELKAKLLSEKNTTILSITLGLFVVSLLGLFLFRLLRKVRAQKEIIGISLKEKDTLLREIHHRVKNNLQVISSLLRLQSNSTKDEAAIEALKEGQSRVQSMSLIHQNLYGKDNLTGIGMKNYLEQLSNNLVATYSTADNISLKTDIADLKLDVDTVVPLGLIINELVTNSLKYAFPNGKDGEITIKLKEENDILNLSVIDNGIGFDSSNVEDSESFGFGLIQAFTGKLDAEMIVMSESGTHIQFKIKEYKLI